MSVFRFCIALLLACNALVLSAQSQQYLQSYQKVGHISKDSVQRHLGKLKVPRWVAPARYAVDIYEVIYASTYHDGSPITASGLYFVPIDTKDPMPLLSFQHGTTLRRDRGGLGFWGEQNFCMGFAADGYAVAYPDYFGLGKSEGKHLYCHAESQSQAVMDMLRAVREINKELRLDMNGQLFLTGYSQGGHVTMGTHRDMQEQFSDEFKVTACSPMSGPYDLSGVQSLVMTKEYSDPGYLPYLLTSYNEVYKLYGKLDDAFIAPYDSIITQYYTGQYELSEVNHFFPKVPQQMVRKELVEAYFKDPQSPLRQVLKANDVYDWTPESPTLLCFCKGDEQVTYKNAEVAYNKMRSNGSRWVQKRHAARKFGHVECSFYTAIYTKLWFDSFVAKERHCKKVPRLGRQGNNWQRFLLNLSKGFVKKGKLVAADEHDKKTTAVASSTKQ